jgi:hypothetical protein
VFAQTEGDNLW